MELNEALELDNAEGAQVLLHLDAISQLLEAFRNRCPHTFTHMCEQATGTGEMSLGDAIAAVAWATDYLMQDE